MISDALDQLGVAHHQRIGVVGRRGAPCKRARRSSHHLQAHLGLAHQPLHEKFEIASRTLRYRPLIGLERQFLECTRGRTGRKCGHDGTLFTNRPAQIGSSGISPTYSRVTSRNRPVTRCSFSNSAVALARRTHHVGQHMELVDAVVAAQHLGERIGVGHRRRLIAHHQQHMLGRLRELHDAVGDARRVSTINVSTRVLRALNACTRSK